MTSRGDGGKRRRQEVEEKEKQMDVDVDVGRDSPPPPAAAEEEVEEVGHGDDGDGDDSERERREIYNALFEDDDDVNDVSDGSTFFSDFPPLPDFPCMSSSSSSSSTPGVSHKPAASTTSYYSASSSAATSWAVVIPGPARDEHHLHHQYNQFEDQAPAGALSSTASMGVRLPPPSEEPDEIDRHLDACTDADECINVMQNFGYMDLLDNTEAWDPASIFSAGGGENLQLQQQQQNNFVDQRAQKLQLQNQEQNYQIQTPNSAPPDSMTGFDGLYFIDGSNELSVIFFDWLKKNKDYITPADMRSIKLKRSTIDIALRRLGNNKEGKAKLLKLILEWVELYQLKKKRPRIEMIPDPTPCPSPGFDLNRPDPNMACSPWQPPPQTPIPQTPVTATPIPQTPIPATPVQEFSCVNVSDMNPYCCGGGGGSGNYYHQVSPEQYHHPSPMDCGPAWNVIPGKLVVAAQPPHYQFNPSFPDGSNFVHVPRGIVRHVSHTQAVLVNGYRYPVYQNVPAAVERMQLPRLGSSATKEARKNRMARHKRILPHRHHQNQQNHQVQVQVQVQDMVMCDQHQMHGVVTMEDRNPSQQAGNWVFWPSGGAPPGTAASFVPAGVEPLGNYNLPEEPPMDGGTLQQQRSLEAVSADHNKENGLKFLLQKVLKQSDVGNLGRIVLPKREAESHLPELETRDGITLALRDIGNNRVFTMRYRFWPNNKSRMYLLENTGEFVKTNSLQEGDFIVIYSDVKNNKYMIRGVKVRPGTGTKPEPKKPAAKKKSKAKQPQAAAAE